MSRVPPEVATPDEERLEASLRPRNFERVRRARPRWWRSSRSTSRRAQGARRRARPLPLLRPAGPGQDLARLHPRRRAGRRLHVTSGPGARAQGRPRRAAHKLEPRDILFIDEIHRLSPRGRGVPLPGDGGLPPRHHHRRRASARGDEDRAAALHPGRRHHPHGPAHLAAARPLPDPGAARLLRARRAREDPRARARGILGVELEPAGAEEIAAPRARHAPHRQPPAAAHPRLRRGGGRRRITRAIADARARARWRSTGAASTRWTGRSSAPSSRSSAAARWAWRPSPPRGRAARHHRGRLRALPPAEGFLARTPRGRVALPSAYAHLGKAKPVKQPGSVLLRSCRRPRDGGSAGGSPPSRAAPASP